jgi:CubicO group peptidase (beta-lactamase class C family)
VIVRGGRVVHQRGFGVRDDSGAPVTPETPFYLGSTTKSFTAVAVLQLAELGRVDLDAPVQRYLSWFTLADSAASRGITVRDLLLHRGRIPGRAGEYFLSDRDTSARSAERHVRWLAQVQPGKEGFDYSNLGYTTLGLVVEAASGEPLAAYLRAHVFAPLGLRHSYTERRDARRSV